MTTTSINNAKRSVGLNEQILMLTLWVVRNSILLFISGCAEREKIIIFGVVDEVGKKLSNPAAAFLSFSSS